MMPEFSCDLKIISLMSYGVNEGMIPSKLEIGLSIVSSNSLLRLTMKVAPKMSRLGHTLNSYRICATHPFAGFIIEFNAKIPSLMDPQTRNNG